MLSRISRCIRKCKRTMVMGSLYMKLLGVTGTARSDLHECNRHLKLTREPDALKFPGLMSRTIWDRPDHIEHIRELIKAGLMEEAVTVTINGIPTYLNYSKDMRGDMRAVLRAVARVM